MQFNLTRSVPVIRSARVLQLSGLFDVPPEERSERSWSIDLPLEPGWRIGLIVGPSGSGKSTIAAEAFPYDLVGGYEWPADRAVVDGFPDGLGIKDITGALSSVGFSSPPSWLRPFHCLSNGEQFRATLARALVEPQELVVMDEFTSVVDRNVAQVGSAAVAKAVRNTPNKRFVAVTCHADVEEWLSPDWVLEMPTGTFTRRSLPRPPITLEIVRVHRSAWDRFKHHHYLDSSLSNTAKCFCAVWGDVAVAFASVIHSPGRVSYWREHRTVCLPDYQGVGIGNALSEFVAGVMLATGKRYMSTTSNPAMIRHRAKSKLWKMHRAPSQATRDPGEVANRKGKKGVRVGTGRAFDRLTAGFEYTGASRPVDARRLGVIG